MIYLNNSSDTQQVYIPRQEIKKDAVSKYVTENELRDALANETARTEETYQKIADMSAYTQTSGFATINGQIITNGGNIEIDGAIYSAGTNIDIDENNVISVTGITVPTKLSDLENDEGFITESDIPTSNTAFTNDAGYITTADTQDFVTSADVKTQVEAYNYVDSGDVQNQINESISGKADSSAVTSQISEVKSEIEAEIPSKVSDLQNDLNFASTGWVEEQGYITDDALSAYSTTNEVEGMISNATSGKMDTSGMSEYYTSAETNTAIENAVSGKADTTALTQYYTSAETNTAINNAVSGLASETYVNNAVSGKMDTSGMTAYATTAFTEETYLKEASLEGLFDSVEYVSSAKTIYFYDKDNTEVGTIDTTDFVKDGMVDNVYISGDTLYIVFNTDAGKETIEIALTDIFNPANYYTKSEVDSAITAATSGKVDTDTLSAYSTTVEVENMISGFTTSADVKTQIEGYNYVNSGDVQSQINDSISGKADTSALTQYYTSAQTDTAISNATSGLATEQYVNNSVSGKADTSALTEYWTSAETQNAITAATDDMATQTWVGQQGYLTAFTETDPVFKASAASGITSQDINNWDGKLDASALTPYYTSGETNTAINNAVSGKADADAFSAYTPTSGFATINGSAITEGGNIVIQGGSGATYSAGANIDISAQNEISVTGITSYTGITSGDITTALGYTPISGVDLTDYYTSAQTDTQINNATSGKQDTLISGTNIKTINNESLLGSGNIVIQGGSGGTNIIELTQAEYDALTAYTQDAVYVITDAEEINLDEFVSSGDLQSYYTSAQTDTQISNATSGKADAASTTARNGYYFPAWNSQGIITGTVTTQQLQSYSQTVNGNTRYVVNFGNGGWGNIYAPTTAGSQGQIVMSNGSGAPVWSSVKMQFISQSAYDALATKDSSTIYFIISEN